MHRLNLLLCFTHFKEMGCFFAWQHMLSPFIQCPVAQRVDTDANQQIQHLPLANQSTLFCGVLFCQAGKIGNIGCGFGWCLYFNESPAGAWHERWSVTWMLYYKAVRNLRSCKITQITMVWGQHLQQISNIFVKAVDSNFVGIGGNVLHAHAFVV